MDPFLINRLPPDLKKEVNRYIQYAENNEKVFQKLIWFYIDRTGGKGINRREFEKGWYSDWKRLTNFFRKYRLNYDIIYERGAVAIDYDGKDTIDDKIINNMIILILTELGLDKDIVEDLNFILVKNKSNFRIIGMGPARHRYFEISKIDPEKTSIVRY